MEIKGDDKWKKVSRITLYSGGKGEISSNSQSSLYKKLLKVYAEKKIKIDWMQEVTLV